MPWGSPSPRCSRHWRHLSSPRALLHREPGSNIPTIYEVFSACQAAKPWRLAVQPADPPGHPDHPGGRWSRRARPRVVLWWSAPPAAPPPPHHGIDASEAPQCRGLQGSWHASSRSSGRSRLPWVRAFSPLGSVTPWASEALPGWGCGVRWRRSSAGCAVVALMMEICSTD